MSIPIHITCDDLGMHPDINDGIVDILTETPVKNASLMATGLYFDHAVKSLNANGIRAIGVHLVMGSEYPKLPMTPLSKRLPAFSASPDSGVQPEVAEEECRLQIQRVLDQGLQLSHIDGHMFFYEANERGKTDLQEIAERLALEFAVPLRLAHSDTKPVFIWEEYETTNSRFDFYDQAIGKAIPWQEWILHPLKTDVVFKSISASAHRRMADYQYLMRRETWDRFERLGVECVPLAKRLDTKRHLRPFPSDTDKRL